MIVTVYSTTGFHVLRTLSVDGPLPAPAANEAYLQGDFLGHRVDPGTLTPQPLHDFDITISPNRIDGLPVGTKALVGYTDAHIIDDGDLEIDVEYDEVVPVWLIHPLYSDLHVEVPCEG